MDTDEAVLGAATKNAIDLDAGLILVMTQSGLPPHLVAKYRPRCPVLVMTDSMQVARACAPWYALVPYLVEQLPASRYGPVHWVVCAGVDCKLCSGMCWSAGAFLMEQLLVSRCGCVFDIRSNCLL